MMPINQENLLYHATYLAYYQSIREKGLIPGCRKSWTISKNNVVYLAPTPELACSFAETAEDVSEETYASGIICLGIPYTSLNETLLQNDENFRDNGCFCYNGRIPPKDLFIMAPSVLISKKILGRVSDCEAITEAAVLGVRPLNIFE